MFLTGLCLYEQEYEHMHQHSKAQVLRKPDTSRMKCIYCYTHRQQYCNCFRIQLLYVVPTANWNFQCKHDSIHISAHPPVVAGTFHSDQHQIVYIHYHDTKWLTAFLLSHSSEHSVAQIKCSLRIGITEVIYLRTWQILDSLFGTCRSQVCMQKSCSIMRFA